MLGVALNLADVESLKENIMKDSKYCQMTSCCWGMRHEILGLILLIIAAFLTIISFNGLGIFAMFLAGIVLCCCKHIGCHVHDGDAHCHSIEEHCVEHHMEHDEKLPVKKASSRAKK